LGVAGVLGAVVACAHGCASTKGGEEERVRVIHPVEPTVPVGGISPEKQAEILLVLQNRNPSTLKCYEDVLDEKHDRAFKGDVAVLVTIEPSGQASNVVVETSTLNDAEVHRCLVDKIREFEFPAVAHQGTVEYVYHFEPAY
jgi:hypothetical protein